MRRLPSWVALILPLLGLLLFIYVPSLFFLGAFSFQKYVPGRLLPEPVFTFENYARFLLDPFFLNILFETSYVALVVTLFGLLISYPLAYALVRSRNLRTIILPILTVSLFASGIARVFGWVSVLADRGILNNMLLSSGVIDSPIKLLFNLTGVMISMAGWSIPIVTLTLVGSINSVDVSLEQAAQNLGATEWQTFLRITLPLTLPGIMAAGLFCYVLATTAFIDPVILGGGRVHLLAAQVYESMIFAFNYPFASTTTIIMITIVFVITGFSAKVLKIKVTGE